MFCKIKIVAVCLMMQSFIGFAQITQPNKLPREEVTLTTDRTIYFAGEQIWLKTQCWLANTSDSLSTVMYVELLDKKSNPVVQKKLRIVSGCSEGRIEIPTDILTGNYYIRAYTHYMRNFGEALFYTTELTIVNPELPSKEAIQTIVKDSLEIGGDATGAIEIVTKSSLITPNSLVRVEIAGEKGMRLSVSVVKKGSYEPRAVGIQTRFKIVQKQDSLTKLKWFPEIRSVSISGKVVSKETGLALKGTLVYASIIDSAKQFHTARTNVNGDFVFSLFNLNTTHQIYLCAQNEGTILVNSDFATGLPSADYVAMQMDSTKVTLLNAMYTNVQVTNVYKDEIRSTKIFLDTLPDVFRSSSETVFFKDYVNLPTLTDMFKEIVPYILIQSKKNQTSIQSFDKKTKQSLEQPLVLLDYIPFHDHAALLNVSPSKIKSVGVIANKYVLGSEVIGGVIDIRSNDNNLAGLPLPSDVVVVDYITYDPLVKPQFENTTILSSDKPTLRNTLYWNPCVDLTKGKGTIQFYSGNDLSQYDIVVRGVDKNGKIITKIKEILWQVLMS